LYTVNSTVCTHIPHDTDRKRLRARRKRSRENPIPEGGAKARASMKLSRSGSVMHCTITSERPLVYRCCLIYGKGRRLTVPAIDAATAEDAAILATKFMPSEAAVEVWLGADLVLTRQSPVLHRKKGLEQLAS
jgi:hypothetical protein